MLNKISDSDSDSDSREEIFENLLRLMRFGIYFETKMAIIIKK